MNKIIPVWKPPGPTSFEIIKNLKKNNKNIKIGHCGTLDPFAEGVLILCTGSKTKDVSTFMDLEKTYSAKIVLGYETDTLDNTGDIIRSNKVKINQTRLKEVLSEYEGYTYQSPPSFSAVKYNGVRLYEFARKNIFITLKPRKIFIRNIHFISLRNKILKLQIICNKGTYIRSLARDIAYTLGTYAYLDGLIRISIGDFDKEVCVNVNEINKCQN